MYAYFVLVVFLQICSANFLVYYNDNTIFVNNSNDCTNLFIIKYNQTTKQYMADNVTINYNGSSAKLQQVDDVNTYIFIYVNNQHDSVYNIFSNVLIYKNDYLIATSQSIDNNIVLFDANGEKIYYINQISTNLCFTAINNNYYFGTSIFNNTLIPSNIIATGIGVLFPDIYQTNTEMGKGATIFLMILVALSLLIMLYLVCECLCSRRVIIKKFFRIHE